MYAIIRAGHRQFKVRAGTILRVTSFLKTDRGKPSIEFPVVAIEEGKGIVLGTPLLTDAQVKAKVLRQGKTKKVLVFKKKRRKGYRRTKGHRQDFMEVEISEIKFPSGKVDKSKGKEKPSALKKASSSKAKPSADQKTSSSQEKSVTKKKSLKNNKLATKKLVAKSNKASQTKASSLKSKTQINKTNKR